MAKDFHIDSCCVPTRENSLKNSSEPQKQITPLTTSPKGEMVKIPGGKFLMGSEDRDSFKSDGEGPIREVQLGSFLIDPYAVTNHQFSKFVRRTRYITEAEKFGWSFVFAGLATKKSITQKTKSVPNTQWWLAIENANWKHPSGPGSNIEEIMNHPVVHISWHDSMEYCKWAKKRLPTESEWEMAARGGLIQNRYAWGNELSPGNQHMCNIWQGQFPVQNTAEDGYVGTAPSKSFPQNGYGLFNMSGNVWEWTSDWFSNTFHQGESQQSLSINPQGPNSGESKVIKGGSYLCHESYCNRYRVAARSCNTPDSSTGNMGFRCAKSL